MKKKQIKKSSKKINKKEPVIKSTAFAIHADNLDGKIKAKVTKMENGKIVNSKEFSNKDAINLLKKVSKYNFIKTMDNLADEVAKNIVVENKVKKNIKNLLI